MNIKNIPFIRYFFGYRRFYVGYMLNNGKSYEHRIWAKKIDEIIVPPLGKTTNNHSYYGGSYFIIKSWRSIYPYKKLIEMEHTGLVNKQTF